MGNIFKKQVPTELIKEYYSVNALYKDLGKKRDKLNKQLKELIKEPGECIQDGYKVKVYNQDRSKFNEDRTILFLKGRGLYSCIKTVEKVDEERLEAAIYSGEVSKKELEFCIDPNVIMAMTITQEK